MPDVDVSSANADKKPEEAAQFRREAEQCIQLTKYVEGSFQTPVANNFGTGIGTTGTINPGVIWVGNYFQVGVEALVPINRASGSGVGVIAQLHFYLDDIFPTTIGRPLFGQSAAARPIFGN